MSEAPPPELTADADPAPSPPKSRKRLALWIAVGVVAVGLLAAAVAIPISISNAEAAEKAAAEQAAALAERDRLATFALAFNECRTPATVNLEILDDGESVSFARVGKYNGPTYDDLLCFLRELDAPASLETKIGSTRALDGAQSDEWPGYEIEWRYHPDDGATVLIEHADS